MDGQKKIEVSAHSSVINSLSVSFPLSHFTGGLVRSLTMLSEKIKGYIPSILGALVSRHSKFYLTACKGFVRGLRSLIHGCSIPLKHWKLGLEK